MPNTRSEWLDFALLAACAIGGALFAPPITERPVIYLLAVSTGLAVGKALGCARHLWIEPNKGE